MTRAWKICLALFGIALLLLAGVYWVLGTDTGTRWALARSSGFLPGQLSLGETQGSFLRGIRFQSIEWRDESVDVLAQNIYIDVQFWALLDRNILVDDIDVAQIAIAVRGGEAADAGGEPPSFNLPVGITIATSSIRNVTFTSGEVSRSADDIRLAGNLYQSRLDLERLEFRSAWLNFDLDTRTELADPYPGTANIDWQWQYSDAEQFAGKLTIEGDLRNYNVQHYLTAPLVLSTSGRISYQSGTLLADLVNDWESLYWEFGERILRSSGGSLRVEGNTSGFSLSLDTRAQLDDLPETTLALSGEADLENMQVGQFRAHNDLGSLSASGNVRWLPSQEFDLNYTLSDIDPSMLHDAVTGKLRLEGKTNIRLGEQSPVVTLEIAQLDGNVNGYPVLGSASVRYANDTLSVSKSRFRIGSNRVDIAGSLGKTLSLSADMDIPALAEIIPEASGTIQGNVMISGSRESPNAKADITGTSLEYQAYSLGKMSVAAEVSPTKSSYAELRFDALSAEQFALDSLYISANGRLGDHTIKTALSQADNRLLLDASGGYTQSQWTGLVDLLEFNSENTGRWATHQSSALTASAEEIVLSETCMTSSPERGHACIGGKRLNDGSASIDLSITALPISAIPARWPAYLNVSGFVDASMRGDFVNQRLTGELGISLREPVVNTIVDEETISVRFTEAMGQATIVDNRVESNVRLELADGAGDGNLELSIQNFADIQSAIAGRGEVTINDASLFAVFIPGVTDPTGKINGAIAMSGSLRDPEFVGEIGLTDGAVGIRQTGIRIYDFAARLTQQETGQLRLTGSARSGEGEISIEGLSRIGAESGVRTELTISGANFELARLPDWQVNASPDISILFDERSTRISGELGIPAANVTIKEIPETAESPSRDAVVHRAEGSEETMRRRITIDVRTSVGPDVQLSGYGLRTGLSGSVRVQGGTHSPYVGNGKLTLNDGRYKAYGQDLEIERGELIFNGPLENPQLDVRAVRRLTDVAAGIRITGTPLQLRSELYSDPALSDVETLSYLLTGRPLTSATSSGEGDTLNSAAFALGLSGAGPIASQIRSGLGLETLTVEGGSEDGRIIAGKRFGDRLLVEYGYGIIDKLGTLLLRYQLSDRVILESRTGSVSNLDIVYSVKKK